MPTVKSLNYRSPKDDARVGRIANHLRQREAGFWLRTLVKFATGIPVLLIGPILLGSIFNAVLLKAHVSWNPGWLPLFGLACLIIIPILFLVEIRGRGDYFLDQARWERSPGDAYSSAYSYTDGPAASHEEVGAAYMEVLLFAPRQILSAISDMRQRIRISSDEMRRAAEMVGMLLAADSGVNISQLRRGHDSPESMSRILRYLEFHDWIDISKRGDRAWLISTARKRFKS